MPERRFVSKQLTEARVVRREDGKTSIEGHAAVFFDGSEGTEFELFDGLRERIDPGAFDRALKERQDVVGLFNHDPNNVLARTSSGTLGLSKDKKGLRFSMELADTGIAGDVANHIERGDVSGASFAFLVRGEEFIDGEDFDLRIIKDVDLLDVGPVTFPAYTATDVESNSANDRAEVLRRWKNWKKPKGVDAVDISARYVEIQQIIS